MKCKVGWHLKKKLSLLTRHYNDQIHTERDHGALHLDRDRLFPSTKCDEYGSSGKLEDNGRQPAHRRTAQAAYQCTTANQHIPEGFKGGLHL